MILMKENILMIRDVDMVYLLGHLEINIKVNILMISDMDTEKCIGMILLITKGNSLLFLKIINDYMLKVYGRKESNVEEENYLLRAKD